MSLCDKCYAPGACCKRFELNMSDVNLTTWVDQGPEAAAQIMIGLGRPFRPFEPWNVYVDPESGRQYQSWYWQCINLVDGRCADYDNRPDLCRNYAPRQDHLCAMFLLESGDGSAEFGHA
jgi:Fe-S-cluster containining protein